MLHRECPAPFRVELRHIDFANREQRTQRQRDHAPPRMLRQPRQRDSVVAIAELAPRRSRRGVMMHTGSFDMLPATLLRHVINGQRDLPARLRIELLNHEPQHHFRHLPRLPTDADQRVVKPVSIIVYSRRDEPRTGRPPIVREQHPGHEDCQPKAHPQIERPGHLRRRQPTDQRKRGVRGVPPPGIGSFQPPPPVMPRGLGVLVLRLRLRQPPLTLNHPWERERNNFPNSKLCDCVAGVGASPPPDWGESRFAGGREARTPATLGKLAAR